MISVPRNLLQLTPRWRPLSLHPEQSRAWYSPARFKTIHAGRRSGKTELFGKRRPVLWLWDCLIRPRPWLDPRRFIAAPTRQQVKDIYWTDIKALTPKSWIKSISESELKIITHWGAELCLVGLDKPQRMEGVGWDCGTIDEYASAKRGLFDANVRPAIADRLGGVDLIGVPDFAGPAQDEYRNFCEMGQSGKFPEWADFAWGSAGILPDSEIESMRKSMDPRLFEQETTGKFMLAAGVAFPDFDRKVHVRDDIASYDPSLPICWCLDFNVSPMCSGVVQHSRGVVRVIDELVIPDTVTPAAVTAFLARAKARGWNLTNLTIYGDAAGNQRKTTAAKAGDTDWVLVRNGLNAARVPHKFNVPRANPGISDTRNAVNAKLMNGTGEVTLYVNSGCRQLIGDLSAALWPSKDDFASQHALAWLRYFTEWEYPIRSNAARTAGVVAVL